jgi:DNA-directed RNA polymerase specialized sigma24 family protein
VGSLPPFGAQGKCPVAAEPLTWLERHGDYLHGFSLSRFCDESAAEDAVQETFLAAIRCCGNFAARSDERTWLTGILKHKILDHYRGLFRTVNVGSLLDGGRMTISLTVSPIPALPSKKS